MTLNPEEITVIPQMVGKQQPAALLLNSDDWGFGHFVLDNQSLDVLESNLGNVESALDRAVVI